MTKQITWLRTLVEGVVIVGSILLAFGIEAGWAERNEREEERSAALALKSDFEVVANSLDSFRRDNELTVARMDSTLGLLRGQVGSVDVPVRFLAWGVRTPTPAPPTGALEALLNSGRLTVLGDPILQRALAAWPGKFSSLQARADLTLGFVTAQMLPVLGRSTDIEPVMAYRTLQMTRQSGRLGESGLADAVVRLSATDEVRNALHTRRYLSVELAGAKWLQTRELTDEILLGLDRYDAR